MKEIATAAQAAIEANTAQVGAALEIVLDEPVRVWTGEGILQLLGEDYTGLSNREMGVTASGTLGGTAQNITLTLSGLDPEVLQLLDAPELRGAPVALYTLVFDASGRTLLDHGVHRRGRIDRVPVEETAGGTAMITLEIESAARGLGRRTGRMRSNADQRLIEPDDGSMKAVTYAGELVLYWGGEKPARAGTALARGGQ